ncbi:MAG: four helix bundle protein [Nitrospirae bacterium]|nr:four helix bundle protein [Nitrospirota bacterium]
MFRFEKLAVWQKAMDFNVEIYNRSKKFPKEEIYGLTSQLRRAATSIVLNIAEGSACKSRKEFTQFLYIALRSQYEVATILKLLHRLNYIDNKNLEELERNVSEIGMMLQGMINTFQKQLTTNN